MCIPPGVDLNILLLLLLLQGKDLVPLYSIDALVEMFGFDKVDVLKTDTEGFDALALASAHNSLLQRKISMLTFEYHHLELWKVLSLEDIVDRLNGFNFVCYYTGEHWDAGP